MSQYTDINLDLARVSFLEACHNQIQTMPRDFCEEQVDKAQKYLSRIVTIVKRANKRRASILADFNKDPSALNEKRLERANHNAYTYSTAIENAAGTSSNVMESCLKLR